MEIADFFIPFKLLTLVEAGKIAILVWPFTDVD